MTKHEANANRILQNKFLYQMTIYVIVTSNENSREISLSLFPKNYLIRYFILDNLNNF